MRYHTLLVGAGSCTGTFKARAQQPQRWNSVASSVLLDASVQSHVTSRDTPKIAAGGPPEDVLGAGCVDLDVLGWLMSWCCVGARAVVTGKEECHA